MFPVDKTPAGSPVGEAPRDSKRSPENLRLDAAEALSWATFSPATFARAKRENKYIVLDGAAEWCHWCHVMEATTYHDPKVRKILERHFISVKVDVDTRPDVQERYGDYGWPATVIFAPNATELGKYRGYIDPEKFAEILLEVIANRCPEQGPRTVETLPAAPRRALEEEHLLWIQSRTDLDLDGTWDEEQGGWGTRQKAPLGWNNAWTLQKAEKGDPRSKARALFALDQQSKLLDPVWGGIYQYSAASDWDAPHFEKLMTFQAPALDNYATAFRLTGNPKQLARAKTMLSFLDRFMKGPEGGFYTTQDADLNAHERAKPFMDGHEYYALNESARLARGIPRVDTHEYGKENGLAIAAYSTMYEVTRDLSVLASAEKAAKRIQDTHTRGLAVSHDIETPGQPAGPLFLSDNAWFGLGLMRLFEVTKNSLYLSRARAIADFILSELTDEEGGGLFASTKDPAAVGVFAARRIPFEDNVAAVRLLSRIAHSVGFPQGKPYGFAVDRVLRAISRPEEIQSRGRMIGDYLLALEESKGIRGHLH